MQHRNNFIVSLMNKHGQMFFQENGQYHPIANIPEHITRLVELSENCHFFIDSKAFKAMGEKSIPGRFTRIFVYNEKDFEKDASLMYRLHHIDELDTIIARLMHYQPDVNVFFIGFPEFLEKVEKYCSTVLLTIVNSEKIDNSVNFPDSLKQVFNTKQPVKPEQLDIIRKFKENNYRKKLSTTTISSNGMKIIKNEKIEISKLLEDTPEYYFYLMTR